MTTKIRIPEFTDTKSYERYKQELLAWRRVTHVDKKKQGITVALSLPEEHKSKIREQVFEQLTLDVLDQNDGFDKLVDFLDKELGKDDLADCLDKFEEFEDFRREKEQTIVEHIAKFDQLYRRIESKQMTLKSEILAFKLIRKANISKDERMLVMTGMDFWKRDSLYDQAKSSLKKFKGEYGESDGTAEQP